MRVLLQPQFNHNRLEYDFSGDSVQALLKLYDYVEKEVQLIEDGAPAYRNETDEETGEVIQIPVMHTVKELEIVETQMDIFDFADMPNGILDGVETTLKYNPIISAKRENGVLHLELLNFIGEDATEQEKFPDWQEV
ncbi:hypothetical protein [Marinicrinis lubricantis]|uniref:Uncharacterized protein n=1 Tax=Marinicrinis lubricantis TaxID=2086470 RepID=A0ABW1IHW7_9BACL